MVTCPFCYNTVQRNSKEHWLPRAWGEYFPRAPGLVSAKSSSDGETSTRIESLSAFDKQYRGICAKCNSEWLREIDVAAQDVALRLALTRAVRVAPREVAPLARSLYRAALVGIWGARDIHGVSSSRMREFYESRLPPDGVQILVGKSTEPFLFAGAHVSTVTPDGDPATALRSFAFGTLGSLFVLVIVPEPGLERAARMASRKVKRDSGNCLVQLWPNQRRPVVLPAQRIDPATAARCCEMGVLVGSREPSVTPDPALASDPRFAPGGSAHRELRRPSRMLDVAVEELESWAVAWR